MKRILPRLPLVLALVTLGLADRAARCEQPRGPGFVKPSAIPTGVVPIRMPPRGSNPTATATERTVRPVPNGIAPETITAPVPATTSAAPAIDATCGHWIVSSRRAYNEHASGRPNAPLNYYFDRGDGGLRSVGEQSFGSAIANGVPTCVVVFGSYNRWEDASAETHPISRWLRSAAPGQPLNIVFFTWPADGVAPFAFPVEIAILGRRSSYQGVFVAEMLSHLPPGQPLCVIGHSHGARTVAAALHLMSGGEIEGRVRMAAPATGPAACRVVMLVAAMDHHWLNPGQRYDLAMTRVERMLNVKNTLDGALGLYTIRKPGGTFALGGPGLDWTDRAALGAEAAKISEMDISKYTGAGHSWQDIHRHRDLALALRPYVFFDDAAPVGTTPTPAGDAVSTPARTPFGLRSTFGPVPVSPTTTPAPRVPAGPAVHPSRSGASAPRRPATPRFPDW